MGLRPRYLAADTAYGTGKFLSRLISTGITPYIPVWDMSQREDGTFSRADFTFDKERNVYLCPAGKLLTTTGMVHDGRTILYRASTRDCGSCPIKPQCTPNMIFRKIPRDVHEDARNPSPLRANAPAGPLWCTRRVPPRGHRPKPQDTRQLLLAPAAAHTCRCVSDSPER
jgi:hypothetical protein